MNSRSTAENNVRTLNLFNLIDSFIMLWPIIILYYIKVGGSVASSGILLSVLTISMSFFEINSAELKQPR